MSKSVMIAVPAYQWSVSIATMRSLFADMMTLRDRGDKITLFDESGSTDLADARALMVSKALDAGVTHLVNIDSDVGWERGALVKLVDYPVEMVGAAYPRRVDPVSFPVRFKDNNFNVDSETGLLEVEAVPGGFVRYTAEMLCKMVKAYSELEYNSASFHRPLYGIFDPIISDSRKFTEDNSFAHRWRSIGGKVWLDPNVTMVHVGPKAFIGNLAEWLKSGKDTV